MPLRAARIRLPLDCPRQVARALHDQSVGQKLLPSPARLARASTRVADVPGGACPDPAEHGAAVVGHGNNGRQAAGAAFLAPAAWWTARCLADGHNPGPAPPFHSVIVHFLTPASCPVVLRGLIALLLDEVGQGLVMATERCCPPVQPMPMTSAAFPPPHTGAGGSRGLRWAMAKSLVC